MSISKFFVNGSEEKLSKQVLADDVASSLLPAATSEDEGKVVCVNSAGQYELSTVESGLPVATAEDAGKVVAVDETGEYELAEVGSSSTPLVEVTYAELKSLRDSGTLVPGQQYRITDYVCTVANDAEARAVSHPYDIIVIADSENTLNENARACLHEGDDYYSAEGAKADLSAWQLKYTIDNDADHFAWADSVNGKGVVFWLKDEHGNECPYDFKQIQFKRYKITACEKAPNLVGTWSVPDIANVTIDTEDQIWAYTFSYIANKGTDNQEEIKDFSVISNNFSFAKDNLIAKSIRFLDSSMKSVLCNNVWIGHGTPGMFGTPAEPPIGNILGTDCESNTFGNDCKFNTLGSDCRSNTFGNQFKSNTLGNYCWYNTFGDNCSYNTFGNDCTNNAFDEYCGSNTFGSGCCFNTFSSNCSNNVFGRECGHSGHTNVFGINCTNNAFGNNCFDNTFGTDCNNNIFGNSCQVNTLGEQCEGNTFGYCCFSNTLGSLCSYNIFENNVNNVQTSSFSDCCIFESCVEYVRLTNASVGTYNRIQNYHVLSRTRGSSRDPLVITPNLNNQFCTYIGINSSSAVNTWVPADTSEIK